MIGSGLQVWLSSLGLLLRVVHTGPGNMNHGIGLDTIGAIRASAELIAFYRLEHVEYRDWLPRCIRVPSNHGVGQRKCTDPGNECLDFCYGVLTLHRISPSRKLAQTA